MAKLLTVLVIIVKVLLSNGQDHYIDEPTGYQHPIEENPNYSYGYGVSDSHTGDIKTVWEAKKGDTVKGHYSVIEPDGSMRSVEYSAGPNTGFTAPVNKDGLEALPLYEEDVMEEKALRDYDRNYDFSEDADNESSYKTNDRKRKRHPYESLFKDYPPLSKRPKYPIDMEPSEYTHSFSIKHQPHDLNADASGHSHVGVSFDPNCKTKNKKQKNKYYSNGADLDFHKQKYPPLASDSYNNDYDKYVGDSSNIEIEKLIHMYKQKDRYKPYKPDESNNWSSIKNSYPEMSDIRHSEDSYSDYLPPRPKKKHKPHKTQELYESDDLDDYVLVPKKKLKKPPRAIEQYHPDSDEEFDEAYEEERFHKPPRGAQTEIIRKVVKKKKPIINILDIFDI
ncbi:jg18582 [Pararge aegeria aegeria]|uniref:Jg18582 protein n=2 Tax=Pararge aegeria TaxID=116150 RepID=A0A8S4R7M0_9NEOP|nr:jg18582 [Pararge aegeria aegeria]